MDTVGEEVHAGAPEILKKVGRIGGWTCLLVILTLLFLSVIEGKDPLDAVADFDLFLGLVAFLICVLTAVIFEVVRSIRLPS